MTSRSHIISLCATAAVSFAAGFYVCGAFNKHAPETPPEPSAPAVTPANNNTLQGPATVYDGDTIKIQQEDKSLSVRIWGIDAPELRQTCQSDGKTIPCGKMSRDAVKELIDGKEVRCEKKVDPEGERNGRYVATCFTANGNDIAKELTRRGLALAYTEKEYGNNFYKADEDFAKSTKRGLWGMTSFETPKQWRTCVLPKPENRPRHCPN